MRSLLATGPAGTSAAFTKIARTRVKETTPKKTYAPYSFFTTTPAGSVIGTKSLSDHLARARSLYGIGFGFESLALLVLVIKASLGLQWEIDSELEDTLAIVDGDISQALQSCREQLVNELVADLDVARMELRNLRAALMESKVDSESWGGDFAFERSLMSVDVLKL